MYFSKVYKEYLPAMAELEASVYPEELAIGLEGFERERDESEFWMCSVAGFVKGDLVCYITAYEIEQENNEFWTVYISDMNCPNPMYLERLLIRFFAGVRDRYSGIKKLRYMADMRAASYRLLSNRIKRDKRGICLLEDIDIPRFYGNGESVHRVAFSVNLEKYLKYNWKACFLRNLDREELTDRDILSYAVDLLEDTSRKGVDFHDRKNMDFVLKHVEEKLLDYFQMFGAKIPLTIEYILYGRTGIENGFEKAITVYQSYGYKEGEGEKNYRYYNRRKLVVIKEKVEAYNTDFTGILSGYRWLVKREGRFYRKMSSSHHGSCYFRYYNKYGIRQDMVRVPYLNERMYLYYLNRMICIYTQIEKMGELDEEEETCFRKLCKTIYYLLDGKNALVCIEKIVERWNDKTVNYFHDWNLVVEDILTAESILTEGAKKSILLKPYNQALKLSRHLKAVLKMCSSKRLEKGGFHLKEVRKNLSSLLRNNIDCTEYIRTMNRFFMEKNKNMLQIPVSEEQKAEEYIARVQFYSPWVTILDLYQYFGGKTLLQFIQGTYPCLFVPQEIQPSYERLSEFILDFLKIRTAQAKHVYRDLRKNGLLSVVQSRELTEKQYEDILQTLKFHNVPIEDQMVNKLKDFKLQVEPKGSPEFLAAGDASVCCMGCGSRKAIDYATEKGFGILNAYYKGRIIANSVIWIHEVQECLVFDNIEVHPNYMIYKEILKGCFLKAARELMQQYGLKAAVQGSRYNDLILFHKDAEKIKFSDLKARDVKTENFYSDAAVSRVLCRDISRKAKQEPEVFLSVS